MGWLIQISFGICLIILAGGLVNWMNTYMSQRASRAPELTTTDDDDVRHRLDEIERRLTEVQDVMIALSEQFDRWEQRPAEAGPTPRR